MSEPLWCPIRQHYCRCHEYGPRCDDFGEDGDLRDLNKNAAFTSRKLSPAAPGSHKEGK
jgi:hypothetical protein